jgi:hypothetical protein
MSPAGLSVFLVLAAHAVAGDDPVMTVQSFDRVRDSTYLLASNDDLDRFGRLWSERSIVEESPTVRRTWDASFRIDFESTNQIWLYDTRAGIATRLSKQLMPRLRVLDIVAFNELLRFAAPAPLAIDATDHRSE